LAAIALRAAVYYYDWKRGTPQQDAAEESKPAFHFTARTRPGWDITHAGQKFVFEKKEWRVANGAANRHGGRPGLPSRGSSPRWLVQA